MLNSNKSLVTSMGCILLGLALYTPTAFAGLNDDPPSLKVSYKDLDMSKQEGAEALYRRIKWAANRVCEESFHSAGPLRSAGGERKCVKRAIDNAVNEVNEPQLTALWKGQTRVASTR